MKERDVGIVCHSLQSRLLNKRFAKPTNFCQLAIRECWLDCARTSSLSIACADTPVSHSTEPVCAISNRNGLEMEVLLLKDLTLQRIVKSLPSSLSLLSALPSFRHREYFRCHYVSCRILYLNFAKYSHAQTIPPPYTPSHLCKHSSIDLPP